MTFLHGIEFVEGDRISPVQVRNASVIGLVGTAAMGPVNVPTLVISQKEAQRIFGTNEDYTIPKALNNIFNQGQTVGYVVVVNVGHESQTIQNHTIMNFELTNGVKVMPYAPIVEGSETVRPGEAVIFGGVGTRNLFTADLVEGQGPEWVTNQWVGATLTVDGESFAVTANDAGSLTVTGTPHTSDTALLVPGPVLVRNVDYVIDYETATITRVTGKMPSDAFVISYDQIVSTGTVSNADIVGAIDPDTDAKTGIMALRDAENVTGYKPKLLIAPEYSSAQSVMNALVIAAGLLRGRAIGDVPVGSTKEEAHTYRDLFDDVNATIVYPNLTCYKIDGVTEVAVSGSVLAAGIWSRTINEKGYWYSPSNHVAKGVIGMERYIDYITDSSLCTASYLNENGVTTFIKRGSLYYLWGNLSATSDDDYAFACVQITRQVHMEAFLATLVNVLDRPINRAWFEDIQDTVQNFLNGEVAKGAIIYGKFEFLAEDNSPEEIRLGHVTARWDWTPAYPAQRITIKETLNIEELSQLFNA